MKKILLQLHLYGGLACAAYLVVFGLSSLNFNHHFGWMEATNAETRWERQITLPDIAEQQPLAEAIRDSLDLFGWTPPWNLRMDADTFHCRVVRMGKEYHLRVANATGSVQVKEITKGFWPTFNGLHFLGEHIPNAPWLVSSFPYYQDFTVFVILFSVVSGVWLWSRKKSERKTGLWLIFGLTGVSLLFMVYLWLVG